MATQNQVLMGVGAGALIVILAIFLIGISPTAFQIAPPITEVEEEVAEVQVACGNDGLGELRLAFSNPLNTSATEYVATAVRIYKPDESYTGDITATINGLPAEGSGTSCSQCGQDYTYYVEASDGSHTSTTGSIVCEDGSSNVAPLPQQAGLLFKVRDEEEVAYVYPSAETSANTLVASGTSFYSTTSNSTGNAIGTDEDYDYTVWTQINKSAAIDTQFTDQSLLMGMNADDLSDWDEPYVNPQGAASSMVDCPTKISNDGYDWCWEITTNGQPLTIAGDYVKVNIQQQALGGVNPSDDITVGFFTSGYFKKTLSENMALDYNRDNPAKSYVYTGQTLTFVFT